MRRATIATGVAVIALGLLSGQQLVGQAPRASTGLCDAGAALGSRACRVFHDGRLISQAERERIQREGSGGAVMTPDGIFVFDTLAELDRFDAGRAVAAAR